MTTKQKSKPQKQQDDAQKLIESIRELVGRDSMMAVMKHLFAGTVEWVDDDTLLEFPLYANGTYILVSVPHGVDVSEFSEGVTELKS